MTVRTLLVFILIGLFTMIGLGIYIVSKPNEIPVVQKIPTTPLATPASIIQSGINKINKIVAVPSPINNYR